MQGHHETALSSQSPASFNPYLDSMSGYPGQYGIYPHHFSKLRGPHDLNAYGDYPSKPQQAVPTYKWMQVKRNVPKPGLDIFHYILYLHSKLADFSSVFYSDITFITFVKIHFIFYIKFVFTTDRGWNIVLFSFWQMF